MSIAGVKTTTAVCKFQEIYIFMSIKSNIVIMQMLGTFFEQTGLLYNWPKKWNLLRLTKSYLISDVIDFWMSIMHFLESRARFSKLPSHNFLNEELQSFGHYRTKLGQYHLLPKKAFIKSTRFCFDFFMITSNNEHFIRNYLQFKSTERV